MSGPNLNTGDFISRVASFREAGDWGRNTGAPVKYGISGNPTPSLKISRKSVKPFSRNVADKETKKKKERKKEKIARKQYPYRAQGKNDLKDAAKTE